MAQNEELKINITADTSAGEVLFDVRGRQQVSIQGDFGGGTLTHFIFTQEGRGASLKAITVEEAYESHAQWSEFALVGSTTPDLNVIMTPIDSEK